MLGADPLDKLVIPDGTTMEEHRLVTDRDVLVGGQSRVEFGIRGNNILAGERVEFGGEVEAEGDARLDMWTTVDGNVVVGRNAYLGERVLVDGRLVVGGDLDIGDDVDIDEGFEANGWIVIRNPMPTVVFFMAYLAHLLKIGADDEAKELIEDLAGDEADHPMRIPRNAHVSDDAWRVSTPAVIGDDCRLHGNIRARDIEVGDDSNIFGSLRSQQDIHIGADTKVHGDVTTRGGDVTIEEDATILGNVVGADVEVQEGGRVQGRIRANGETNLSATARTEAE